jgi:serine protease AprX
MILIIFTISVIILWAWAAVDDITLGGPPQALLTWEDEFREITGVENVANLDGTGVRLCIVDSGIDLAHPDFKNLQLSGWHDAINDRAEPYDDEGHGTAMAGIIVADGGLSGVASGVELLIAKAIDSTGTGTDEGIAESVDWCVSQEADIISLSLGGEQGFGSGIFTTDTLEESVENAIDDGVFVIAAAGNDGEDDDGDVSSPGSVENVICVGGITRTGNLWSGSSEGDNNGRFWPNPILPRNNPDKKPEIVAPGHEVPILFRKGSASWWGWSSGTSASTAWVSGTLALMLEEHPELQREGDSGGVSAIEDVKQLISETSQMKDGQSSHDDHYGYGILRIDLLLDSLGDNSTTTPFLDAIELSRDDSTILHYYSVESERRMTASVAPESSTKPIV